MFSHLLFKPHHKGHPSAKRKAGAGAPLPLIVPRAHAFACRRGPTCSSVREPKADNQRLLNGAAAARQGAEPLGGTPRSVHAAHAAVGTVRPIWGEQFAVNVMSWRDKRWMR